MPTIIRKKAAIIRRAVRVSISIPYIYSLSLKNLMGVEDPLIGLREGRKIEISSALIALECILAEKGISVKLLFFLFSIFLSKKIFD